MEQGGEVSEEIDGSRPGSLFRVRMMVLGPPQVGKTSLVQRLLYNTDTALTSARPDTGQPLRSACQDSGDVPGAAGAQNTTGAQNDYCPTDGVHVELWSPFKAQGLQRLLNRNLTNDEQHLTVELWDTSGRTVCQPVYGLFLIVRTVCVIVYDVTDTNATDNVVTLYRMIRHKLPDSTVVVVANKTDALDLRTDVQETCAVDKVVSALTQQDDLSCQNVEAGREETETLLKDTPLGATDNDAPSLAQPNGDPETGRSAPPSSTESSPEGKVARQHLTYLEQRCARETRQPRHLRAVAISALSGQGLEELRKVLLEAALDCTSCHDNSISSVPRPSTLALYDQILALRERDTVMLHWQNFHDVAAGELGQTVGETFRRDLAFLEAVGAVMIFSLDTITFPAPVSQEPHQQPPPPPEQRQQHPFHQQPQQQHQETHHDQQQQPHQQLPPPLQQRQTQPPHRHQHYHQQHPQQQHHQSPPQLQQQQQRQEKPDHHRHKQQRQPHLQYGAMNGGEGTRVGWTQTQETGQNEAGDRYVCVHPATLACLICCCLLDDEKKSFRFEAGRFWPRDSGFKHPHPQLLATVLQAIPQRGVIRESLFPLIWQDYTLSEAQVLTILDVLQGEGLLADHGHLKTDCPGLALPGFPRLSVHRHHALPLLGLQLDNRPQLNWTAKPFSGDIQVTWTFHMRAHIGLLQCLLAGILFVCRQCCHYRHAWRSGVLLRIGEVTVCVEHVEDTLRVAGRVNGDEAGRETEAVRVLWVTLTPVLYHVRRRLLECPGLHFKETVTASGQQFYLGETAESEPDVWLPRALSLWHRRSKMSFADGGADRELDVTLLFPFEVDSSVVSVEDWLTLVMSHTDVILSEYYVTMTSSLPPLPRDTTLNRISLRGSSKQQKKKKSVEVKWRLHDEHENSSNNNDHYTASKKAADSDEPPLSGGSSTAGADDSTSTTAVAPLRDDAQVRGQDRSPRGPEVNHQEALRLASGFVAAVLASAMADYVALEAEGQQHGRKLVSAAQIAAARVTAEAALAVQTGNIEGAALAVIEAVRSIKGNNPAPVKSEGKGQGGQNSSRLCMIL